MAGVLLCIVALGLVYLPLAIAGLGLVAFQVGNELDDAGTPLPASEPWGGS